MLIFYIDHVIYIPTQVININTDTKMADTDIKYSMNL